MSKSKSSWIFIKVVYVSARNSVYQNYSDYWHSNKVPWRRNVVGMPIIRNCRQICHHRDTIYETANQVCVNSRTCLILFKHLMATTSYKGNYEVLIVNIKRTLRLTILHMVRNILIKSCYRQYEKQFIKLRYIRIRCIDVFRRYINRCSKTLKIWNCK